MFIFTDFERSKPNTGVGILAGPGDADDSRAPRRKEGAAQGPFRASSGFKGKDKERFQGCEVPNHHGLADSTTRTIFDVFFEQRRIFSRVKTEVKTQAAGEKALHMIRIYVTSCVRISYSNWSRRTMPVQQNLMLKFQQSLCVNT